MGPYAPTGLFPCCMSLRRATLRLRPAPTLALVDTSARLIEGLGNRLYDLRRTRGLRGVRRETRSRRTHGRDNDIWVAWGCRRGQRPVNGSFELSVHHLSSLLREIPAAALPPNGRDGEAQGTPREGRASSKEVLAWEFYRQRAGRRGPENGPGKRIELAALHQDDRGVRRNRQVIGRRVVVMVAGTGGTRG